MQMIACNMEESSEKKKMERDNGLNTVDCLRGRLLAERQASKTAKEDAELMNNKLIELENKLKEETKIRNKAEKRLKLLKKKLDSLKILPSLEESDQSISSEHYSVSSVSCTSTSSSSGTNDTDESACKSENAIPDVTKIVEENALSNSTTSIKILKISSSEENSNPPESTKSDSRDSMSNGKSSSSHEDSKIDDTSSSSLETSKMEIDMNGRNGNYEEDDDYVNDALALVPLKLPESQQLDPDQIKIVNKSVGEVLDTLRHARERIQSSIGTTQMIRVGPS